MSKVGLWGVSLEGREGGEGGTQEVISRGVRCTVKESLCSRKMCVSFLNFLERSVMLSSMSGVFFALAMVWS